MMIKSIKKSIQKRQFKIGVIGLGYVGLPLAVEFAKKGFETTGFEIDEDRVKDINSGQSYVLDVDSESIRPLVHTGKLKCVSDFSVLKYQNAVIICVPTPLRKSKDPDVSYIISATKQVQRFLRKGQVIILESTSYPGTTKELVKPILEKSSFKAGKDFYLAFSPERVDPGNKIYKIHNTPKIVGGIDSNSTEISAFLYSQIIDKVIKVSNSETAEIIKLLENTFRAVNIAMINEMALMCHKLGIDVWEVIDAASSKPFGFMTFYPGPGIGGHCLSDNEFIFLNDENGLHTVRIGDFVKDTSRNSLTLKHRIQDVELFRPRNVQTLSFDLQNKIFQYKDVRLLSRRPYQGEMKKITTMDGRCMTVTDRHPMVVCNTDNDIVIKLAKDIIPGDRLPVTTGLPVTDERTCSIDIIDYLKNHRNGNDKIRVKFLRTNLRDNRQKLYPLLRKYRKNYDYKDIFRGNYLPLPVFLKIEKDNVLTIDRKELLLCTGRGPSYNQINAVIDIDEDFSRLIGYYLSEGCQTGDVKTSRIRWTFNRKEQDYITDIENTLKKLNLKYSIYSSKKFSTDCLKVSSRIFATVLTDILQCGKDSYTMKIPSLFFKQNPKCRFALLSGLLRGDAGVNHYKGKLSYNKNGKNYSGRFNTANIEYFTASPVLYQQTIILAQSLGFIPTFKNNKKTIRFYGHEQLKRMSGLFISDKLQKLEKYFNGCQKINTSKVYRNHGTFITVPVKRVDNTTTKYVYSMEVADTNTFVSSYGIVTHNCIPLDPHYLGWKMKMLNFEPRFIELAGAINSSMPEHIVTRISQILNIHGKTLKSSRLLIIGMAYKPDISDDRESPAKDIFVLLRKSLAKVDYYDPYIPSVVIADRIYKSVRINKNMLKKYDCVIIITSHSGIDYKGLVKNSILVFDARNATKGIVADNIYKL